MDCIRHALPIVPFKFRNERIQRFENFVFAKSRHEIFQVVLNFSSYRRLKHRGKSFWDLQNAYLSRAALTV